MTNNGANSKYVKKRNRITVLNLIKEHGPIGRQELAQITGLTPPAITGIIRELLDLGLVQEVGYGESRGGRRPVKLTFNSKAGYVIGVEVTRGETAVGVADLMNDPTDIARHPLDMSEPAGGLVSLVELLRRIMNDQGEQGRSFVGVGVAFPGLVQAKTGTVQRSVNLGPAWRNYPLREKLEDALGLPVFIENNSNACVLAERWFGGGVSCRDLVYINLGEGISAGVILDDRIVQGFQGYAGEIGHIVIDDSGPLCNCGNRGCLEALCSVPALIKQARRDLPGLADGDPLKARWQTSRDIELADLLTAAQPGTYAGELLSRAAHWVGRAVAAVINLYNPEAVFLGGRLAGAMARFEPVLLNAVAAHAFPEIAGATRIAVSSLGEYPGVIGACALALKGLLHLPEARLLDAHLE
ncbi:ROK family transcriptional regulator [Sporolituus thermophilus]|uniref:Transcriptional regulator, MarR family n=1 Tax=Sporolituus thermophilus DSM 23256 TaxID=1123285 RepID=A0A1G7PAA3_9FIRM|nr:ROK family transcriptional regulator [Sporolituus thermophilus]SDF82529.1 transcriptional regulator, MarR family [Sporolituus thermophilus DSM 23256]